MHNSERNGPEAYELIIAHKIRQKASVKQDSELVQSRKNIF